MRNVAATAGVSITAYRAWEAGTSTPLLSRLERLVSALGVPACALSAPEGFVAVTDVQLTPEAAERVRRLGQPEAQRVADQIAGQLTALILQSCRQPLRPKPDGRGKPRRSRAQVLAGIAEANEMRANAQARRLAVAGPPQGDEKTSVGGLPGALTAEG